jgi:hypothetical protein
MPIQTINNVALHYDERGDRTKPALVFAGSVLFGAEGFDDLIPMHVGCRGSTASR